MTDTFSLRFRLLPSTAPGSDDASVGDAMFALLDEIGVGDDVSNVAEDGSYALWLELVADGPQAALSKAMKFLAQAQEASRPGTEPDGIMSIEVLVMPDDIATTRNADIDAAASV
jgi:hypothetical protein